MPNNETNNNIFQNPLSPKVDKAKDAEKSKNKIFVIVYLSIASIILSTYSIFFLYSNVKAYINFDEDLKNVNTQIEDLNLEIDDEKELRNTRKAAYDKEYNVQNKILNSVFPKDINKLQVINLIENMAKKFDEKYGDFQFSSISFSNPISNSKYTILPFNTSITCSNENFKRFLSFVNMTGDLNEDSQHLRLLDISNISVNFKGIDRTGKDEGVSFNVKMNAYSQPETK